MKAALNGGLNLSILDGWWDEWYDGSNGWAIPSADGVDDVDRRDDLEATALYDLIEKDVAPRFYDVDHDGVPGPLDRDGPPHPEVARARRCSPPGWSATTSASSTRRRRSRGRALNSDYKGATELAAWKKQVRAGWADVRVEHVESHGVGDNPEVGSVLTVRAFVALGVADARRRRGRGRARRDRRRRRPGRRPPSPGSTSPTATTAAATASTATCSSSAAAPSATPSGSSPVTPSWPRSPRWAWSPFPDAGSAQEAARPRRVGARGAGPRRVGIGRRACTRSWSECSASLRRRGGWRSDLADDHHGAAVQGHGLAGVDRGPGGCSGQVDTTTSPSRTQPSVGTVTLTGSASALSQIRNELSHCCSPRDRGRAAGRR